MNSPDTAEAPLTATELKRRGRRPGPFLVSLDGSANGLLSCGEVVRSIPRRRLVCRGEWQGQAVFIKLYLDGRKYWRRELRGLQALHNAAIPGPVVMFSGTADQAAIHVIVLRAVESAMTLQSAWAEAGSEARRIELLQRALRAIADHHNNGLVQQDIHLDNFLLAGDTLVSLDGGGIRVSGLATALAVKPAMDNLALFFAQFPLDVDELIETVLPAYIGRREWDPEELPVRALLRRVRLRRRWRQRRLLEKVFRDCSAFACDHNWWHYRVYDRTLESLELIKVLVEPDASLQYPDTRILKQGNTCTLWTIRIGDRRLVIKRYNIKGMWHGIRRAFRETRAAGSWRNAHRLRQYGIATARPIALVEERFGPLRGRAWYLCEYVAGDNAATLCESGAVEPGMAEAAMQAVVVLLQQLKQCHICHGDMKATNFILADEGPVVVDLDAMQEYSQSFLFRRCWQRDMHRFMRNWDGCTGVARQFSKLLLEPVSK